MFVKDRDYLLIGKTRDNLSMMTKKFPCIVFLAMFKDNATFFAVVVSSHGKHVVMPKKMCVSGYQPSSSFRHQP